MAKCDGMDLKCISCSLRAAQWGKELDCENCDYYMEKVLKGEVYIEDEEEE